MYVTPNEMLKSTVFVIKTFNRPECLMNLVNTVQTYYPSLPIIIGDDGYEEDEVKSRVRGIKNIQYIRLPVDSGVSYGRNELIKIANSYDYEYVIMSDDDYIIEEYDLLLRMARTLQESKSHSIVAPYRCDQGNDFCDRNHGLLELEHGKLHVLPNITIHRSGIEHCYETDIFQQFFIARTSTLHSYHWDNVLKNNDHYDFLLNLKRNNIRALVCSNMHITHSKKECQSQSKHSEEYSRVRGERWEKLLPYWFQKYDVHELNDENGKTMTIHQKDGQFKVDIVKGGVYRYEKGTEKYISYMEYTISFINSMRPSWLGIRATDVLAKPNWVVSQNFGVCYERITTTIEVMYDRPSYMKNKNEIMKVSFFQFLENCPMMYTNTYNQVTYNAMVPDKEIFILIATTELTDSFFRILQQIRNQKKFNNEITIIVSYMNDHYDETLFTYYQDLRIEILVIGPPFSRTIGLQKGVAKAIELAKDYENAVMFATDTSISIHENLANDISRRTICGKTYYAPVVKKCKQTYPQCDSPDQHWVVWGYGIVGVCLSDVESIDGYNTDYWYKWGAEDLDLAHRLMNDAVLIPYREKTIGLSHNDQEYRTGNSKYYTQTNLYENTLPIIPIVDTLYADRFMSYIKHNLKHHKHTVIRDVKGIRFKTTNKYILFVQYQDEHFIEKTMIMELQDFDYV